MTTPARRRLFTAAKLAIWLAGNVALWAALPAVPRLRLSVPVGSLPLAFDPDDRRLIVKVPAGPDNQGAALQVWDAATGRPLPAPNVILSSQWPIVISPDGRCAVQHGTSEPVVVPLDGTHAPNPEMIRRREMFCQMGRWPEGPDSFAPDGRTLVIRHVPASDILSLWDRESRQPRMELPGGDSLLAWSADSRWLAFCPAAEPPGTDFGRRVTILQAQTGRPSSELPPASVPLRQLAFSPDGGLLAGYGWQVPSQDGSTSSTGEVQVVIWDLKARSIQTVWRRPMPVGSSGDLYGMGLSWAADGLLVTADTDPHRMGQSRVEVWDAVAGTRRVVLPLAAPEGWTFGTMPISRDGTRIAVGSYSARSDWQIAVDAALQRLPFRVSEFPSHRSDVQVFDVRSARELAHVRLSGDFIGFGWRLSRDGRTLATVGPYDTVLKVWDVPTPLPFGPMLAALTAQAALVVAITAHRRRRAASVQSISRL